MLKYVVAPCICSEKRGAVCWHCKSLTNSSTVISWNKIRFSQVIHEQHLQMEAVDAQSLRRVSFGYHRRPVSPQASIKQCIDGAQNTETPNQNPKSNPLINPSPESLAPTLGSGGGTLGALATQ